MSVWTAAGQDRILPYFETVCRDRLDAYFAQHGFVFCKSKWPTTVMYVRNRIFLEMSYWVEDAPRYILMLGIGLLMNEWRCDTLNGQVGLWSVFPAESDAGQLDRWLFSSAPELDDRLAWCRDRVLDVYAKPLWQHQEVLSELVQRSEAEVSAKIKKQSQQEQRKRAEEAFKTRNYREVVSIYNSLGDAQLSALEQRRLHFAQKWLDASNDLAND